MSLKAMLVWYVVSTAIFVLVAMYVLPMLGAKPHPPTAAEVLHAFHLDHVFGKH